MKKVFQISAITIGAAITVPAALIMWLTLSDFQPEILEKAEITNEQSGSSTGSLTILNWNIGYGGLGENMDFFMDGGTKVRAPREEYNINWNGIQSILSESDADVYFFQEMDRRSTRSYKEDQYETVSTIFDGFNRTFAPNYKVKYIPSPRLIGTQYGSVHSGLSIFSRFQFLDSERYSLPGNYKWPKKVFFLDRCLLVSTIPAPDGKSITLINAHLSAYDKGGFLKKDQLIFLKELAEKEYSKGGYVIIGGDWNSYMPGTDSRTFQSTEKAPDFYQALPEDWNMEGWTWGVDPTVPTNRSLAAAYRKGETFTPVIDGFLLSPNIQLEEVKTMDLGFKYTDHNPIEIKVRLR